MELRLNKEGHQFILGLPMTEDPLQFSQLVVSSEEVGILNLHGQISGFASLADAQEARLKLENKINKTLQIYKMTIYRMLNTNS